MDLQGLKYQSGMNQPVGLIDVYSINISNSMYNSLGRNKISKTQDSTSD